MRGMFYAAARNENRRLRLPPHACCTSCGANDRVALVPETRPLRCADCDNRYRGKSIIEGHHPLGRANAAQTIPLRATTHRYFTDRQHDWPRQTLRNPSGDPGLRKAAALRSIADLLTYLATAALPDGAARIERRHQEKHRGSATP